MYPPEHVLLSGLAGIVAIWRDASSLHEFFSLDSKAATASAPVITYYSSKLGDAMRFTVHLCILDFSFSQVKSSPRHEELVGGSVVMGESPAGPAGGGGGNGRGAGKETERERLARRLKERSHSRRAGSTGTNPGR